MPYPHLSEGILAALQLGPGAVTCLYKVLAPPMMLQ